MRVGTPYDLTRCVYFHEGLRSVPPESDTHGVGSGKPWFESQPQCSTTETPRCFYFHSTSLPALSAGEKCCITPRPRDDIEIVTCSRVHHRGTTVREVGIGCYREIFGLFSNYLFMSRIERGEDRPQVKLLSVIMIS